MHALAICATIRDEGRHLREWVAFHRLLGVEYFWLYDNFSKDRPQDVLAEEREQGVVEIVPHAVPFHEGGQRRAYQDCLERFGAQTKWLAFLDVDEFLTPLKAPSLPEALLRFQDHPAVVVNWLIFGSSGRQDRAGLLTIEAFTRRAPTTWVRNQRVKSIVQPARTEEVLGAHVARFRAGAQAVNGAGQPVRPVFVGRGRRRLRRWLSRLWPAGPFDPYAFWEVTPRGVFPEHLVIHHYATRSLGEEAEKRERFASPRPGVKGLEHRKSEHYFRWHDRNEVQDTRLLAYAPAVRRALGLPDRPAG